MQITLDQARDIINANDGNNDVHVASFCQVKSTGYSYTTASTSYHIALSNADRSYLLFVSPLAPTPLGPITLPALATLLTKILNQTSVPVPWPIAHDVSGGGGRWSFGWLLLRLPVPGSQSPTSLASLRDRLSPVQRARIELRLGTYLRALHRITNDWFGVPMEKPAPDPPAAPSFAAMFTACQGGEEGEDMTPYSWQDTFVLQLEELLDRVCGDGSSSGFTVEVDVAELRRCLFRAIGSFLFDDVEMPGLIWVTGNEEDVIVVLTQDGEAEDTVDIAYMLPTFGRALWGDPLMEAWFMPPGPTAAIHQGYFEGDEDGTLIVFPRHNTKRTWYTVYLALLVLAEERENTEQNSDRETIRWARRILPECVEILKSAPCY